MTALIIVALAVGLANSAALVWLAWRTRRAPKPVAGGGLAGALDILVRRSELAEQERVRRERPEP